jgi:hemoglobin-like flavoprotein
MFAFRKKGNTGDHAEEKADEENPEPAQDKVDSDPAGGSEEGADDGSQAEEEEEEAEDHGDEEGSDQGEGEADKEFEEGADEQGGGAGENQEQSIGDKATGSEIVTDSFCELSVPPKGAQAANEAWVQFINTAESREAAGEVIYSALFDSAPSLQSLFVTPRAVQAMKFMNGLANFVQALDDPPKLKILVETLGFGHLHLDVTPPRVVIFRDAILDIMSVELGERFTSAARDAWTRLLNYVGGAIIYVKANYADRIKTLLESWKIATEGKQTGGLGSGSSSEDHGHAEKQRKKINVKDLQSKKAGFKIFGGGKKNSAAEAMQDIDGGEVDKLAAGGSTNGKMDANQIPTTYWDMFRFNSAVMGFGANVWMDEVLDCFNNIVTNVSNSARLQEECDVLTLRIAKVTKRNINFAEYKSCMLASLRSLLPKDWSTQHEVSWNWLWENVERIMQINMGNPPKWEKALGKVLGSLDENASFEVRKSIYNRFFALAPAGQDFFKQSNTYLHFIADRIIQMTLEIYKDPKKMVDDISALGLRHVGYAIPTEFFNPFVSACCEVFQTITEDAVAVESFRWSLGLISKMLVRTIQEGSTIVMKAINSNNTKSLKKAIGCAPRGERANWLLTVQVGTQRISPLYWSIESGALESAQAIISDLLIFRADRDRYYYGMDALFSRHPEILKTLCQDAPSLLAKLLDGLIWRSRTTEGGFRRANYYIKHLLIDSEGKFSATLSWIAAYRDPRLACHPLIVLLSDQLWSRLACRAFMWRKSWFLFTLVIFIVAQSILKHMNPGDHTETERYLVFSFRAFLYFFSMTQLVYTHFLKCVMAYREGDSLKVFGCLSVPRYWASWQQSAGFLLMVMLVGMLVFEPILWCINNETNAADKLFWEKCQDGKAVQFTYSLFAMVAMLLYYSLLLDLAVVSTKVSSYVLVCIRMLSEVGLFLLALFAVLLASGSSITVVKHDQQDFEGLHKGMFALLEMAMGMYDGKHYETYESDQVVLICVGLFLIAVSCFLLNMLVAQLTCAYEAIYGDMVGYARLERIQIIVTSMPIVTSSRWNNFVTQLKLNEKVEFNAGDVGVTGGFQILEPQNLNPTTTDMIKRFGGSTDVELQWPADADSVNDESDRFDRLEQTIQRTMKKLSKSGKGGGSRSGSGSNSNELTGSGHEKSDGSKASSASGDEEDLGGENI